MTHAVGRRGCGVLFGLVFLLCAVSAYGAGGFFDGPMPDGGAGVSVGASPEQVRRMWREIDDPAADGWDTERFNNDAGKQLKKLAKLLAHPEKLDLEELKELAVPECVTTRLVPVEMRKVFDDGVLSVDRGLLSDNAPQRLAGYGGLLRALRELSGLFENATRMHGKFKLYRVRQEKGGYGSKQYFALSGTTDRGMTEHHSTWDISWVWRKGELLPRIREIRLEDFELARSRKEREEPLKDATLFADCTESVIGSDGGYRDQILTGYADWLERVQNSEEYAIFGTPGLAVGDVNGDGLEDLFVCRERGLPNMLYIQESDGSARDVARSAGVDWLQSCRGALLVDLDNDGDQDLAVTTHGGVVVGENDGNGRFGTPIVLPASHDLMSLSAADYDNDGDLDLYALGYQPNRYLEPPPGPDAKRSGTFVYHDANNGAPNTLFRNDGKTGEGLVFTDVTTDVGLDVNNRRFSLAASWEDYDNDGDQDLYVANDYGRDNLYRNDRGDDGGVRFTDVGPAAGVEDRAGGMAISWADYDRDGWMDVFVSNMWSSAGNRITFQPGFKKDSPDDVKNRLQAFARGNTLLRNRGDGTFENVSAAAGIEMGRWAWGNGFVDINNDGWEDLVVSNGYLTGDSGGGDL